MLSPALRRCKGKHLLRSLAENQIINIFGRNISICTPLYSDYEKPPPQDPFERVKFMFAKGAQAVKRRLDDPDNEHGHITNPKKMFPASTDVLVIGAGAMGSSVAYWLKETAGEALDVVVIDKDFSVTEDPSKLSEYAKASTVLSVGGLRQQFSLKENIEMSLFGAEFLQNIKNYLSIPDEYTPNIQFQPNGYLFLASQNGAETLAENSKFQNELGAKNELLTPQKLKLKFPWINTDGVELACHGLEKEGWFDPWTLLQAFKAKASYLGARFHEGEVIGFTFEDHMAGTDIESGEEHPGLDQAIIRLGRNDVRELQFAICVICAGAQSGDVAALAGVGTGPGMRRVRLPIEPRKRYVFSYECPDGPGLNCPLAVDPSGVYFRRDGFGGRYLAGLSPESDEEPNPEDLEVDYTWFDEKIWPVLAKRVPCFENIKVQSAWAGYYETNLFDENGIIGCIPTYDNLFIAAGFSGHGIQHAPAVGRAIMELICYQDTHEIKLHKLAPRRLYYNEPMLEKNIV